MSWAAVAGAAITVVGGAINNRNARKGQNAALKGQDAATAEQARQYDQSREDMLPWLNAGKDNLGTLQALNSGDFSSFLKALDGLQDGTVDMNNRLAAAMFVARVMGGGRDGRECASP